MTPATKSKFKRKGDKEDPKGGMCEECFELADT